MLPKPSYRGMRRREASAGEFNGPAQGFSARYVAWDIWLESAPWTSRKAT